MSTAHGGPVAEFDLMDPKVQQCPYGFYAAARAAAPTARRMRR